MDLFVTGGSGFIGMPMVRLAVEQGHTVRALTRSQSNANKLAALGAEPVRGELPTPGPWREALAQSDAVLHLAQPQAYGTRVTRRHAAVYREARVTMDRALLDAAVETGLTRFVYCAGTSYYGHQGAQLVTEDATPQPCGWGPYLQPAIEQLARYDLPLVEAYPGPVYGPGSWYLEYMLRPLVRGRTLYSVSGFDGCWSCIHVQDAARAMLHLAQHGVAGQRYFLVDDEPSPPDRLVDETAAVLEVPVHMRKLPGLLVDVAIGRVLGTYLRADYRLSNARLRGSGFDLLYPTLAEGVPAAVEAWKAQEAPGVYSNS